MFSRISTFWSRRSFWGSLRCNIDLKVIPKSSKVCAVMSLDLLWWTSRNRTVGCRVSFLLFRNGIYLVFNLAVLAANWSCAAHQFRTIFIHLCFRCRRQNNPCRFFCLEKESRETKKHNHAMHTCGRFGFAVSQNYIISVINLIFFFLLEQNVFMCLWNPCTTKMQLVCVSVKETGWSRFVVGRQVSGIVFCRDKNPSDAKRFCSNMQWNMQFFRLTIVCNESSLVVRHHFEHRLVLQWTKTGKGRVLISVQIMLRSNYITCWQKCRKEKGTDIFKSVINVSLFFFNTNLKTLSFEIIFIFILHPSLITFCDAATLQECEVFSYHNWKHSPLISLHNPPRIGQFWPQRVPLQSFQR